MTIECHVEVYEIDEYGISEENELQAAISLSKKEFEKAIAKEQKKAKEEQKAKEKQKAKEEQKAKQEQKKKKDTLSCNICLEKYGEEGDRTPRVLDCGHTLCFGCCKQIAQPNQIQCPFCRVVTQLTGRTIYNLPKNYLVLSL